MLQGLTVLLAEDNPTNQIVATQMLEMLGAKVVMASDGVEALTRLAERHVDVMLIDIEMPLLSGSELITRLRAPESPHRDTPMIALTAYVMHEHRAVIDAAGADGVIAKPIVSVEQFGADILRHIDSRRMGGDALRDRREAAARAPAEAQFDPSVLDRLGDLVGPRVMREILDTALLDLDRVTKALADALLDGKLATVSRDSHMLAGLAGTIGGTALETAARRINDAPEAAIAQRTAHIAELEACRAALSEYLQSALAGIAA